MNKISLSGKAEHTSMLIETKDYGILYANFLDVTRRSGIDDVIPFLSVEKFDAGENVAFHGHLRSSFVKRDEDDRFHLSFYAVADSFLEEEKDEDDNFIHLKGIVRDTKPLRTTSSKRRIVEEFSFSPVQGGEAVGYFPCIAWGQLAETVNRIDPDKKELFELEARFQSREYTNMRKEHKTAYELSVSRLIPVA